ncbi:MAG: hypothetical protein JWP06_1220 [Candidatus Saccharibacteria bacterium]|nr:hypothetical protein [Candidatus Saccharibacteria bacterium]
MTIGQVQTLINRHPGGLDGDVTNRAGRIYATAVYIQDLYREARQYPTLQTPGNKAKLNARLTYAAKRVNALIEFCDEFPRGRTRARIKYMALFQSMAEELGVSVQQLQGRIDTAN